MRQEGWGAATCWGECWWGGKCRHWGSSKLKISYSINPSLYAVLQKLLGDFKTKLFSLPSSECRYQVWRVHHWQCSSTDICASVMCLLKPKAWVKLTCNRFRKYLIKKYFLQINKTTFHLIQIHRCFWRSACSSGRFPVIKDLFLKCSVIIVLSLAVYRVRSPDDAKQHPLV